MPLKLLVKLLLHSFFTDHLNHKIVNKTMDTSVEKLSNCCDCILRLSGFPDLSHKVF